MGKFSLNQCVQGLKDHSYEILSVVALVVGCMCVIVCGASLASDAFTYSMQEIFNMSTTQIEIAASMQTIGYEAQFIAGYLIGFLEPKWTLGIGLLTGGVAYILLWSACLMSQLAFYQSSQWLIIIYLFLAGIGSSFYSMVPMVICYRNFSPRIRGTIISMTEASDSFGNLIFATIYGAAFVKDRSGSQKEEHDLKGYFLLLFSLHVVVGVLGMTFVRVHKRPERQREDYQELEPISESATSTILEEEEEDECVYGELSGLELMKEKHFHTLVWPFIFLTGVQLAYMNNLGIMLKTIDNTNYIMTASMLFPSIQIVASLGLASFSDGLLKYCAVPREVVLTVCATLQTLMFLLSIMYTDVVMVYVTTLVFAAGSAGANVSIVPTLTSEYFGNRYIGRNFGFMSFGVGLAVLAFHSTFSALIGLGSGQSDEDSCYGKECFRWCFVLATVVSALCTLTLALASRWRYRELSSQSQPRNRRIS